MPATALTKVTASKFGDGVADAGFQAVDNGNGNNFVNTGRTILLVTRSGGTVNVTFTSVGPNKHTLNDTLTQTPAGGAVTAGKIGVFGPFPTAIYGGTVTIGYDTGTNVTAAVVELEDTPL